MQGWFQHRQAGTESRRSCEQAGMGWDSGVHAHVEGMSKGIGCTSKKWSPKDQIRKCGFSSATSRDGACAAGRD